MASPGLIQSVSAQLEAAGIQLDVLVNNAGVSLGILLKPVAAMLGVPDLNSREHIDRAASALRGFGL